MNPAGPLAAIIGAIIRWWRTRPGTGRHSRQPRHKRKGHDVSPDDDELTTELYGDPLGITPTRREVRGAEPDHPALPDRPPGPLAADVAKRVARQRYADWRARYAE